MAALPRPYFELVRRPPEDFPCSWAFPAAFQSFPRGPATLTECRDISRCPSEMHGYVRYVGYIGYLALSIYLEAVSKSQTMDMLDILDMLDISAGSSFTGEASQFKMQQLETPRYAFGHHLNINACECLLNNLS